jgi:hypothetical protein
MPNIASSVRINGDAVVVLSNLAAKLGQPKAQVVELALKELEEKIFWADVHHAFEQTAADPAQSAQEKAEFELWDRASNTDLKDEAW